MGRLLYRPPLHHPPVRGSLDLVREASTKKGSQARSTLSSTSIALFVPGLLYFFDYRVFRGQGNGLLIVRLGVDSVHCAFALLAVPLLRDRNVPRSISFVFTLFVAIVLFWFLQGENFFYPFSLCMSCCNFGILASLFLFSRLLVVPARQPSLDHQPSSVDQPSLNHQSLLTRQQPEVLVAGAIFF